MTTARIELPPKMKWLFKGKARYRVAKGGRGSGKTYGMAKMTAVMGMILGKMGLTGAILCAREHLNSLEESSLEEVKSAIRSEPWLLEYYDIGEKYIRSKDGRIRYVFAGLRHNLDSIKSKARILIAWIDEAENVSEAAWRKLIPTVREESALWSSEIWISYNPESEESATHRRFVVARPAGMRLVEINWSDNPWFPEVLNLERLNDLRDRPDVYDHIWEGHFLTRLDAQVFANKYTIRRFEVEEGWEGPYYGIDFGFSQDPTTAVEYWIDESQNLLYIRRDCGQVGLELDHTARFIKDHIPGFDRWPSRADSARPESISYLRRHGLPRIEGVKKWAGSVEDGVEFIKSFRQVIIHEDDAPGSAREFRVYRYKVDRLTGDVLPKIVDADNHFIDAGRYALAPMMKSSGYSLRGVF